MISRTALLCVLGGLVASPAIAERLDWPSHVERYDISGAKLGDTPEEAVAALTAKGFECGPPAASVACRTSEQVRTPDGRTRTKAEIRLTFSTLNLDDPMGQSDPVVGQMVFRQYYADPPTRTSLEQQLTQKYGPLERSQSVAGWTRAGPEAADITARQKAYDEQMKACQTLQNSSSADVAGKITCEIEKADKEISLKAGQGSRLVVTYPSDRAGTQLKIEASWPALEAIRMLAMSRNGKSAQLQNYIASQDETPSGESTF